MTTNISHFYLRVVVRSAQGIFDSTNILNRIKLKKCVTSFLPENLGFDYTWNTKNNICKGFKCLQTKV